MTPAAEHPRDHLRVERAAAAGDAPQRVDEASTSPTRSLSR